MNRDRGFSLIEILVVLVITSVSLVVLFEVFASGGQRLFANQAVGEAALAAESKLSELDAAGGFAPGEDSGTLGGDLGWQVSIRPYSSESWPIQAKGPQVLDVTISVYARDTPATPRFVLRTLRLSDVSERP